MNKVSGSASNRFVTYWRRILAEIHVVSPFITANGMTKSSISRLARQACQKGVAVYVYADSQMTMGISRRKSEEGKRQEFDGCMNNLRSKGAQVIEVSRVHSKLLIVDRKIYCAGSFNWLSASRTARWHNQETSFVYQGDSLVKEIELRLGDLADRAVSS